MWGLLVGIVIGILQFLAVNKLGRMILEGKVLTKLIGGFLFMAKMAAIILILYLISTVSLVHLIWTAGGMLLGLSLASLYSYKRRRRKYRYGNSNEQ